MRVVVLSDKVGLRAKPGKRPLEKEAWALWTDLEWPHSFLPTEQKAKPEACARPHPGHPAPTLGKGTANGLCVWLCD